MSKALVVLSGGQDSTTCLFWAKKHYDEVIAISFEYGQRHSIELASSNIIAELAGVKRELITLGPILKGTSPLVNPEFEVEKYESAETLPGGLEKTFVPGRNILFLTIAANRAYVENCDAIVTGVSQEDFGGYPDCREDFIFQMELALGEGFGRTFKIETPLVDLSKKETVLLAGQLGDGCWQALAYSHTCYNGMFPPCGKCHACLLREKGFNEAGYDDPLIERAREEGFLK